MELKHLHTFKILDKLDVPFSNHGKFPCINDTVWRSVIYAQIVPENGPIITDHVV